MPLKNTRLIVLLIIAVSGSFFLASCLDVNTSIEIARKGTVKAVIVYHLDESIADFGRGFGSDDPWPLPLTETDFMQKALMVDGVELVGYKVKESETDGDTITATIKADSIDAAASYLDIPMEINTDETGGRLVLNFPVDSDYAGGSAESREVIDTLVGDSIVSFRIRTPRKPLEAGVGTIDGRYAFLDMKLLDILYSRAPETWEISW